jgi:hypothetical protein
LLGRCSVFTITTPPVDSQRPAACHVAVQLLLTTFPRQEIPSLRHQRTMIRGTPPLLPPSHSLPFAVTQSLIFFSCRWRIPFFPPFEASLGVRGAKK